MELLAERRKKERKRKEVEMIVCAEKKKKSNGRNVFPSFYFFLLLAPLSLFSSLCSPSLFSSSLCSKVEDGPRRKRKSKIKGTAQLLLRPQCNPILVFSAHCRQEQADRPSALSTKCTKMKKKKKEMK